MLCNSNIIYRDTKIFLFLSFYYTNYYNNPNFIEIYFIKLKGAFKSKMYQYLLRIWCRLFLYIVSLEPLSITYISALLCWLLFPGFADTNCILYSRSNVMKNWNACFHTSNKSWWIIPIAIITFDHEYNTETFIFVKSWLFCLDIFHSLLR